MEDKELLEEATLIKQSIEAELTEKSSIPYFVWEKEKRREEDRFKRNNSIIRLLILFLFLTNAIWIYVFQSYDYSSTTTTTTYTTDSGSGGNAIINKDGRVDINGQSNNDDDDKNNDKN
jgi:hypothetical protein